MKSINETEILRILSEARAYEMTRRTDKGFEVLKPIWQDPATKPVVGDFSPTVRGEILLRCGALLSYHSQFSQERGTNERARDWLTEAAEIFAAASLDEKQGEAYLEIGSSYWREGAGNEAKTWFKAAEDLLRNPLSPTHLRLFGMMLHNNYSLGKPEDLAEAYEIIKEKDVFAALCDDRAVKIIWYMNSATIFLALDKDVEAVDRYSRSITLATELENLHYLAVSHNNTACIYKKLKIFNKALEHIDIAIDLSRKSAGVGDLAGCYDSKAQILASTGDYDKALEFADKSIEILRRGETYYALVESLWTKCNILLDKGQTAEALGVYSELVEIARQKVSELSASGYTDKLAKKIFIVKSENLLNEIKEFENKMIFDVMDSCGGLMIPAAERLGVKKEFLSAKILGSPEETSKKKKSKKKNAVADIYAADEMNIPDHIEVKCLIDPVNNKMASVGLAKGTIAVVAAEIDFGKRNPFFLFRTDLGKNTIAYIDEEYMGFYGLRMTPDEYAQPVETAKVKIIGQIVGYCRRDDDGCFVFCPLENRS